MRILVMYFLLPALSGDPVYVARFNILQMKMSETGSVDAPFHVIPSLPVSGIMM